MAPLRRAALSLTDRPLLASGYRPSWESHSVGFVPRGDAVPLRFRLGLGGIAVSIRLRYRLVEPSPLAGRGWGIETLGYLYVILDREGQEIVAHHWHPFARGPAFPHLHRTSRIGVLPMGEQAPPVALGKVHLPTEEIAFPAIVRLLLGEFAVAPRRRRLGVGRRRVRRRLPRAAHRCCLSVGAGAPGRTLRRSGYVAARKHPTTWSSTIPTLCMKA